MGAGASAHIPDELRANTESDRALYLQLEELSKGGFFYSHQSEFEQAMLDAIKSNSLDIVELLLVSGNIRLMEPSPVHLAAEMGKLDVLEILDSAGFDLHKADKLGSTPMMYAAKDNQSRESGNVATFLALRGGKRLCKVRNSDGSTCLHIAADNNNASFIEAVLTCIGSVQSIKEFVAMPNFDKQSALDISEKKGKSHVETSMLFHQFITSGSVGQRSRAKHQSQAAPVDPARMMAVWEAFFENVTKRMMAEEMAVGAGLVVDDRGYAKAAGAMIGAPYYSEGQELEISPTVSRSHVTYNEEALDKVESLLISWFEWTLLHYTDPASGEEMHYLVNKTSGNTVWLTDHLYHTCVAQGGLVAAADFTQLSAAQRREVAVVPQQGTAGMQVTQCVRNGWVQYFDSLSNSSLWLNAFTWACKETLPLGSDPILKATGLPLVTSGLSDYFNGRDVAPDPAVSAAWVMVVYEEEELDQGQGQGQGQRGSRDGDKGKPAQDRREEASSGKGSKSVGGGGVWDIWDDEDEAGIYLHHKQKPGVGTGVEMAPYSDEEYKHGDSASTEDGGERAPYYWNRITGATSSHKPPNYDLINEVHNGGWALVCSEASGWQQYWFHQKSGESRWA